MIAMLPGLTLIGRHFNVTCSIDQVNFYSHCNRWPFTLYPVNGWLNRMHAYDDDVRELMHKFNLNIKQLVQFFFFILSHPSLYIYVNISVRIKFSLLYPPIKLNIFYFYYFSIVPWGTSWTTGERIKERERKRNRWTWASVDTLIVLLLLHHHHILIVVLTSILM